MTHDDLLIEINRRLEVALYNGDPKSIHALRAVVELHKPKKEVTGMGVTFEGVTTSLSTQLRCGCGLLYPCPTVQAIEKELK
jgi:hypothetical protein